MENKKNETVDFITVDEMLDYAIGIFPELLPFTSEKSKDSTWVLHRESMKQEIKRVLLKHRLIEKASSTKAHKISKEVGQFVARNIMRSYFLTKIEEFEEQQEKEMKKKFSEIDNQLTEQQEELFEIESDAHYFGYNNENDDAVLDMLIKAYPERAKEYVDFEYKEKHDLIHKSNLSYHIPDKTWYKEYPEDAEGLPVDFADKVIEKMMLRALFEKFYEFDEKKFRKDLIWRAKFIVPGDPVRFESGYYDLTQRLENPIGYYVFPKEQKKCRKGQK